MKNLILAVALLSPTTAFAASAYEINARDYDCAGIRKVIGQHHKVFVRTGLAGRSFRAPPAQCDLGDMYTTVTVRDSKGQQCVLQYACITDPSSFRNFDFDR